MKQLRKYFSLLILVSILLTGCSSTSNTYTGISYFYDITPNDDKVVFTYFHNNKGVVYEYDLTKQTTKKIKEDKEKSLSTITLSKDGKKIYTLAQSRKNPAPSMIYQIDRATGKTKKLYEATEKDHFVTGVIQGKDENTLYFLESSSFNSTKPIKGKMPHDYDIYELDLTTNKVSKTTNLHAYIAENMTYDEKNNAILFSWYKELENETNKVNDKEKEQVYSSQVYSYNLDTKKATRVFEDVNNKSVTKDLYTPALSKDGRYVAFTGVAKIEKEKSVQYEVFLKDLKTGDITIPTKLNEAYGPVFFNKSNKIFVSDRATKETKASYYIYDMETKKTAKVHLKMEEK